MTLLVLFPLRPKAQKLLLELLSLMKNLLMMVRPRNNVRDRRGDFPPSYLPKNFSRLEFETCNPACQLEDMDEDFLRKLDKLRDLCGFPLVLNCAFRSVEHEKKNGRDGSSYHCAGRAVDILCISSDKRFSILLHAPMVGLNGIGVYSRWIHLDDRNIPACWYGVE